MGKPAGQLKTEQYRNFVSAEVETSTSANINAKFLRIHFKEVDLLQHDRSSLKYYFVSFSDCVDPAELTAALKSLFTRTDAPQISVALYGPEQNLQHRLVLKGLGVPSNPCASSPHIKYTFTPQLISNIIDAGRLESVCQSTPNHAARAVASPAFCTAHVTTTR
ncbi:hypothetical protein RI367_007878 [Sorochytrium milnesiophthora]